MKSIIKTHTIVEKKIKTDIIQKNTLRKELTRKIREIKRLSDLLQKTKNRKKRKRYKKDIERHIPGIREKKKQLSEMINDLEKRISEEMKYSEKELKILSQTYDKEYEEMVQAKNLLLKAQKTTLSDKEKLDISGMSIDVQTEKQKTDEKESDVKVPVYPRELLLARAKKRLKNEFKDVTEVEKEIASEQKDKQLFENELKRIVLEKKILGQ
jgi:hypothetical protein